MTDSWRLDLIRWRGTRAGLRRTGDTGGHRDHIGSHSAPLIGAIMPGSSQSLARFTRASAPSQARPGARGRPVDCCCGNGGVENSGSGPS